MTRIMGVVSVVLLLAGGAACTGHSSSLTPGESELAKTISFSETILVRAKALGQGKLERLVGTDDVTGEEKPLAGFTMAVPGKKAPGVVAGLRKELASQGFLVFRSQVNFGIDGKPDRVAVLRGTDQFEILEGMGTNGINYDITNDMVVGKLKEWDARFGLVVTGADFDWAEAEFVKRPADMDSFAAEVYSFCPDVVDQGTGDVTKLAGEMAGTNTLYLWWD